jgi:hypothetical protein
MFVFAHHYLVSELINKGVKEAALKEEVFICELWVACGFVDLADWFGLNIVLLILGSLCLSQSQQILVPPISG